MSLQDKKNRMAKLEKALAIEKQPVEQITAKELQAAITRVKDDLKKLDDVCKRISVWL